VELIDTPPADSPHAITQLLAPLLWYERRRGDTDGAQSSAASPAPTHAIAQHRKRMGFLVIADLSASFHAVRASDEAYNPKP